MKICGKAGTPAKQRFLSGALPYFAGAMRNFSVDVRNISGAVRNVAVDVRNVAGAVRNVAVDVRNVAGDVRYIDFV